METQLLHEQVVQVAVDAVRFELDVAELEREEQRLQRTMAARSEIHQPVLTRCLTRLLTSLTRPDFLDVGSHTGYHTCYAAALLGPEASVNAVDCNPAYCAGIRRSCERNGFSNAAVFEAMLSNRAEPPESTTLDLLCQRAGLAPNIVKVDVDGNEGKVLFGMTALLGSVEFLLLELYDHHRLEKAAPDITRRAVFELLWNSNLSIFLIAGHRSEGRTKKNRPCLLANRFAYRRVTAETADCLFFSRVAEELLLITPHEDVRPMLGESVNDPLYTL